MDFTSLLQVVIIACYFLGSLLYLVGAIVQKPGLRLSANILAGAGFSLHTLELGLVMRGHLALSLVQSEF